MFDDSIPNPACMSCNRSIEVQSTGAVVGQYKLTVLQFLHLLPYGIMTPRRFLDSNSPLFHDRI